MGIENDVLNPVKLNKKKKLDWYSLWIKKSDNIANYYERIRGVYKIIDDSIGYYIVMMEMAIYYAKEYSNYYDYAYVQHNIIVDDDMYIREDIKERDFSEYLKYLFYKKCDFNYIYKIIEKNSNKFNYYLVGIRLLFPSHYLYYFDRFVITHKGYDKLISIVDCTYEYEEYVRNTIAVINKFLTKKIVLPF